MELSYSKELKIRDLAKKNAVLILEAINYLYVLLGVKEDNKLNQIEEGVFNGLLISSFSNYSLNEIKHAFRLALKGTLEVKLYSKLDAITLSNVMKAYKKHKDNTLKQELNKVKELKPPTELEKETIERDFVESCVNVYLEERKTLKSPKISSELYSVFMYFYRLGAITLTDQEIENYISIADGYWFEEIKEKKKNGERISINTPMPASRQKIISGCLALFDKIKGASH